MSTDREIIDAVVKRYTRDIFDDFQNRYRAAPELMNGVELEPAHLGSLLATFLPAPVIIYLLSKYVPGRGSFLLNGPKGRFHWFMFAALLFLWWTDDIGTAIGMQGNNLGPEGNPSINAAMSYAIDNNWVETETSFLRIWWLWHAVLFFTCQYMRWFGNWWVQFWLIWLGY